MKKQDLEPRVSDLDDKIAEMQETLESIAGRKNHPNPHGPWWIITAGRFKDDSVFEEIVRLGRDESVAASARCVL
jgi:hypothetical protein